MVNEQRKEPLDVTLSLGALGAAPGGMVPLLQIAAGCADCVSWRKPIRYSQSERLRINLEALGAAPGGMLPPAADRGRVRLQNECMT